MTDEEFGEAVNDVINATINVCVEGNLLMRDLRAHIEGSRMKALPLKGISNGDEALKTLRGWRGFLARPDFYESRKGKDRPAPAPDDDDPEVKNQPKLVRIPRGGSLLFAKLVFHDYPRKLQPYFLGGVLSKASLDQLPSGASMEVFQLKTDYARTILEDLSPDDWRSGVTLNTSAKVHTGRGYKRSSGGRPPRLTLQLQQQPVHRLLRQLDGLDAAQAVAAELLAQWELSSDAS